MSLHTRHVCGHLWGLQTPWDLPKGLRIRALPVSTDPICAEMGLTEHRVWETGGGRSQQNPPCLWNQSKGQERAAGDAGTQQYVVASLNHQPLAPGQASQKRAWESIAGSHTWAI